MKSENSIKPLYWILISIIMIIGNITLINLESALGPWLWICLFIGLLIIETLSMDLTTIWFAIGAISAYMISLSGVGFLPQLAVFNILSLGLLIVARPASVRKINNDVVKTNVDAIIGQEVLVLEEINLRTNTGLVRVNGLEWTARALHKEDVLPEGIMVKIEAVEGVKVIVTKC